MKITHDIGEFIQCKNQRLMIPWKLIDGKLFFNPGFGLWQHERLFDKFFPPVEYVKFNDKGQNQDKTKVI